MQFVIKQHAGEGAIFSENAFDAQIGKIVPVNFRETDDGPVRATMGNARLVGVAIVEHGTIAELTLEILKDDNVIAGYTADNVIRQITSMSFKFKNQ